MTATDPPKPQEPEPEKKPYEPVFRPIYPNVPLPY